jgi:SAM-dependent methyltransferase
MWSTVGIGARRLACEPLTGPIESDCPACGSRAAPEPLLAGVDRLHGLPGRFEVARCPACGSGVTLPRAADDELGRFYPHGYGPYAVPVNPVVRLVSAAIRRWQGWLALRSFPLAALRERPAGRAVDVGCGRGDLAATLVRSGWRAAGVEPSANACEAARAQGVDAREGTLATVELEPGGYDAAVFNHSLEHVTDPAADLARVRAALRPGGLVLVTVPNFSSWQRRRFGSRWFHLDLPRHRVHFTAAGLGRALERAGLEPVRFETSTSTVGLPGTLQYALAGRCLFPEGLRLRVASGLSALAYPLARLADRLGRGGDQLHAVARRPLDASTASSSSAAIASAGAG